MGVRTLVVLPVLVVATCDTDRRGAEVRHPLPDRLPLPVDIRPVVLSSGDPGRLPSTVGDVLAEGVPTASLGTFDGPTYTVFGKIEDVAPIPGGGYFVLDGHYAELRRFGRDHRYQSRFGGFGSGPQEFRWPEAAAVTPSGRLAIATRSGFKLFGPDPDGEGLEYAGGQPTLFADDLCALGERIYALGHRVDPALNELRPGGVHVIDGETGEVLSSFSSAYHTDNRVVQLRLSEGMLACVDDPPTVVVGYRWLPYLVAFEPEGRPRWALRLPNYRPVPTVEFIGDDGRARVRTSLEKGASLTQTLNAVGTGHVLVQVIRLGPEDPERPGTHTGGRFDSFLVAAVDGTGARLASGQPWVIAADTERIFALDGEDYPVLDVYQY
jgi:hypothetical protein